MTPTPARAAPTSETCERCNGAGWYWRTPSGFNPFSAGGWATMRAMYKVPCSHGPLLINGAPAIVDLAEPRADGGGDDA